MTWDALLICSISLGTALLSECVSWFLIFRKPQYQRLKAHIEKTARTLDKRKRDVVGPGQSDAQRKEKKVAKLEEDLRTGSKDLTLIKFRSMLFLTIAMMALYYALNRWYDGIVVAKLPFVPLPIFQKMSHRGLSGTDPTDCSMTFLFILSGMGIKTSLSKLFGSEPPRALSAMNPLLDLPKDGEE